MTDLETGAKAFTSAPRGGIGWLMSTTRGITLAPADEGTQGGESTGGDQQAATETDPASLLYGEGDKPAATDGDKAEPKVDGEPDKKAEGEELDADGKPKAKEEDKRTEEEKAAARAAEVPEDGKYEFDLPEGIELDTALAEQAMPILKDAGLSRAQANKMAGFLAEVRQSEAARVTENWAKTQTDWVHSVKTDKEIGGDNFGPSVKASNRVLSKFGTPELTEYLQSSGAGNHPELVRFCTRVAAALSEDNPVTPEVPGSRQTDPVDILYPTNNKD